MRILFLFLVSVLFLPAACYAQFNATRSLTLVTYYPSPNGAFRYIKLQPTSAPPVGHPARKAGTIYCNITDNKLYVFNGATNQWEPVTGSSTLWNVTGSNVTSNIAGNVGIGTMNPGYKLEVNGTGYAVTDFCLPSGQCVSKIP